MISKSSIKLIQSLKLKKFRQKYDLFVAEGLKTVSTMLASGRYQVDALYATPECIGFVNVFDFPIELVSKSDLSRASLKKSGSDVLAVFKIEKEQDDATYKSMIYLDDVQDPGNVGTIIRIADWYGVEAVFRSQGSADFYAPKVVQSAMGSLAGPKLISCSQEDWLDNFDPYIITSSLNGSQELELPLGRNIAFVVGNEGNGASQLLLDRADTQLTIKGASGRMAESLNAAVAAAILCDRIFG